MQAVGADQRPLDLEALAVETSISALTPPPPGSLR
jgi:hypothetical protein